MRALLALVLTAAAAAQHPAFTPDGAPQDPAFFPLGVWLQAPRNAPRYQAIGVNLYVGLYKGPTEEQLAALERFGMRAVCAQNEVGLAHEGETIVAWMHGDEPDNAQKAARGYGPPIAPREIVRGYEAMRRRDPQRPVLLNLGQGVAWDGWHGRGVRTNHPEDYPDYLKGCDIGSFDIYPVVHDKPAVRGRLEFVGNGVRRMREWTDGSKPVWACIETAHINDPDVRPTPEQVRSEVWMAIACGATGIVYFAHEFKPRFVEAGLLAHPEIAAAVKEINAEVTALATVLNSETVERAVTVTCEPAADLAVLCKRDGEDLVVIAASLSPAAVAATFVVAKGRRTGEVEVLGEERVLELRGGRFGDEFAGYGTRRYRLRR